MLEDTEKVELLKNRLDQVWLMIEALHHVPFNTNIWSTRMIDLIDLEQDIIGLIKKFERR